MSLDQQFRYHAIDALISVLSDPDKSAAYDIMNILYDRAPAVAHMTLPMAMYYVMRYETWQRQIDMQAIDIMIEQCQPRAWVCNMLRGIPRDSFDAEAEYLQGIAELIWDLICDAKAASHRRASTRHATDV